MIPDRAIDRLRPAAARLEIDECYAITGIGGYGGMESWLRSKWPSH